MERHKSNHRSTFLRWAGSKRQLLPILRETAPKCFDRYVEPFAGSACLFFNLRPRKALLGDFNQELVHAFDIVKRHPKLLSNELEQMDGGKEAYYALRTQDPIQLSDIGRAARFVYLNAYCFNGVYRTNLRGKFNVPRGTKTKGVPSRTVLLQCSIALRAADIIASDFSSTLALCNRGDFVYLDPPYTIPGGRNRGEYGPDSFDSTSEDLLLAELTRIDRLGVKFLMSYRATSAFIERLHSTWIIQRIRVRRNVAGFASARRIAVEILVRNFEN